MINMAVNALNTKKYLIDFTKIFYLFVHMFFTHMRLLLRQLNFLNRFLFGVQYFVILLIDFKLKIMVAILNFVTNWALNVDEFILIQLWSRDFQEALVAYAVVASVQYSWKFQIQVEGLLAFGTVIIDRLRSVFEVDGFA